MLIEALFYLFLYDLKLNLIVEVGCQQEEYTRFAL
jgi:hypothetical protein